MTWKVLIAFIIFLALAVRRWRLQKLIKFSNQFKSNLCSLPLLGHVVHFFGDHEVHMEAMTKFSRESIERDDFTAFWLGDYCYLLTSDAVLMDTLSKVYLEKGKSMRFLRFGTGNGSIFAPVSIWKPRRKILVPTFNQKNLNNFVKVFAKQSQIMVKKLKKSAETKRPFSLWPFVTTYSMDSVCETTLGVTVNAQENPKHPFLVAVDRGSRLVEERIVKPWLHSDVLYKLTPMYKKVTAYKNTVDDFIGGIIESKRKSMEREIKNFEDERDDKGTLKTFLELLIDSSAAGKNQSYTNLELMEEVLVLVMAGTDTSAVGTSFTMLNLANHPRVQEKVNEELQEVFGDSSRPVTADDLLHLKYLEAVIKETLRLYPPAPLIVRYVDKDYTLPNGLTIAEGCELVLSIWGIHRNPRYWGDDAEVFRPERFLDTPLKHPAQFVPFSYGPRNCVGYQYAMMSMKTTLANLLRSYKVLPDTSNAETKQVPHHLPEAPVNKFKQLENGTSTSIANDTRLRNGLSVNSLEVKSSLTKACEVNGLEKSEEIKQNGDMNAYGNNNLPNNNCSESNVKEATPCKNNNSNKSTKEDVEPKPLRVRFNIMMKHVDNFTVRLEARKV